MTKKGTAIYNALSLLMFNIAYWLCCYYPKHIIEFNSTGFSVVGTFFNLILILIYCFVLTIFFSKSKSLFSAGIFNSVESTIERFCVKKWLLSASVFLFGDLLRYILSSSFIKWSYICIDAITLITWLAVYLILTFNSQSLWKRRVFTISTISILILIFGICLYLDVCFIIEVCTLSQKYVNDASAEYSIINIDFTHHVINAIFDFLIGCTLIIFHAVSAKDEKGCSENKTSWDTRRNVYNAVARFVVALISMSLIVVLKLLVSPTHSFAGLDVYEQKNKTHVAMGKFDIDTECVTIYRLNRRSSKKAVYCATNVIIRYDFVKTAEFQVNRAEKALNIESSGNNIIMNDNFTEYSIEGTKVFVFANDAVSFVENNVPKTIMFYDFENQGENPILIGLCKKMLSEGNVVAFEYGYEYLLKYDKGFILPYITRYSNGKFNSDELEFINTHEYNTSYIIDIAKDSMHYFNQ